MALFDSLGFQWDRESVPRHVPRVPVEREFKLDKPTFCSLHALVARNEPLEWGHFRGEGRETQFTPDVALGERGIDAVSIPAVRASEFNSRIVNFYTSRDATEMMAFVLDCHPEISQIRRFNPGLSAVRDLPGIKYFTLDDSVKQS